MAAAPPGGWEGHQQEAHLDFLFALEVLHQPLEVDVSHLSEEGQQAGHVLSLPIGTEGGRGERPVSQSQVQEAKIQERATREKKEEERKRNEVAGSVEAADRQTLSMMGTKRQLAVDSRFVRRPRRRP